MTTSGNGHEWVGAATVPLPQNVVRQADTRGTVRLRAELKITVLEVYCLHCRRPFKAVSDKQCAALESRDHLIGGPTGERKKRKHPEHDCNEYGCDLAATANAT